MAGINGSMAHLSDTLFTTAIAVYALAMVGYTAEYAFGRKGRIAATSPTAEPARALVGAGGPPVAEPPPPRRAAAPAKRDVRRPTPVARSVALTVLGVLLHGVSIAIRALAVDAVPWSNMYEFASVAGLVGVVAFLAVLWKAPADPAPRRVHPAAGHPADVPGRHGAVLARRSRSCRRCSRTGWPSTSPSCRSPRAR